MKAKLARAGFTLLEELTNLPCVNVQICDQRLSDNAAIIVRKACIVCYERTCVNRKSLDFSSYTYIFFYQHLYSLLSYWLQIRLNYYMDALRVRGRQPSLPRHSRLRWRRGDYPTPARPSCRLFGPQPSAVLSGKRPHASDLRAVTRTLSAPPAIACMSPCIAHVFSSFLFLHLLDVFCRLPVRQSTNYCFVQVRSHVEV